MLKAVIFDMDGVIADTNSHHEIAWRKYYELHGRTLSNDEFVEYISGKHNRQIVSHLFPGQDLPLDDVDRLGYEKEALFRELYAPDIKPVPGIPDFLAMLKAHGIKTAVATSAPVENLDFVIDTLQLRPFFDELLHEKLVTRPKPNPEIYLKAMAMLGVSAEDSIVFEDSMTGIRAGRASGAKVVGVATTHSPAELAELTNDVITDFTEMTWERLTKPR
ncbi:HAD-superfamily hydrolase, subfamily IA, variant 3 [Fibrella aestuarina BUZ 2]|uniref:HAD-superfamily hydrolase, subfamily IA, variant 3 n=1 Tax=Fibrella aestuarina BUZ 2 TaxID=1166018 RepID=I0KCQ4_9BACT|nr:HAD family phosphatase [Fibrella aestuarina]CCH01907.1 HAD-superfamily hydrolase, subfamily IA, variant 3 [Fibrella aestuarina BUZ 2]